ncbi:RNA polymerase sigma factor [uncultured Thiothrix sp.]|mgnify:CR=1 FL=1|uniref:RNA polymerase sigma factor n=1 Tax=uncultured Thiothrix sp. TaxID=223185 RepID=UPI00261B2A8F|nr:RNA polymerase sigma factor [uncultured Thiothrix sp.]
MSLGLSANPTTNDLVQCREMLLQFVEQRGDKGAKLLSVLTSYIQSCAYRHYPLSAEDQQDILQEVAIKILNHSQQLQGNCSAWLFSIVRNEYIDRLRQYQSKKKVFEPDLDGTLVPIAEENTISLAFADQALYNQVDCLERVFDEIARQPTGEADMAIYTAYVQGLSNGEIAERTGRTMGAIAKRLSGLRERVWQLKQELC